MREPRERLVERAVVRFERGARVDVAGRAEALGDRRERHALGEELAVAERERGHFTGSVRSRAASSAAASVGGASRARFGARQRTLDAARWRVATSATASSGGAAGANGDA